MDDAKRANDVAVASIDPGSFSGTRGRQNVVPKCSCDCPKRAPLCRKPACNHNHLSWAISRLDDPHLPRMIVC